MKILQVSHGLPPKENAGVELYTYYLSRALAQLDHPVHVFCREEDSKKEEFSSSEEEMDGLKVTRVINNFTWRSESDPRIFYDNSFFDAVFSNTLKKEKPDLVHFQHIIGHSANLVRIAKKEGYPVVLTVHDFFILCHRIQLLKGGLGICHGPLYGLECVSCLKDIFNIVEPRDIRTRFFLRTKNILPFPIVKWTKRFFIPPRYLPQRGYEVFHRYRFMVEILKIPDLILTPSCFVKDLFLRYYPFIRSKIRALPLGIPPVEVLGRPQKGDGRIRFCYFGNILPFKGVHLLVDAFKALPKEKTTLTIYGSRNSWNETYYDKLKEQANGFWVDFRDPFKRENLSEALRDQDVAVLPSICPETFSLMIREANMMGLPVIASRIGAIPEAVKEGVNGFLFKSGNRDDLKRCMLRFIEEPDLLKKMASKMPKAKSMTEHAVELLEIYQGIVGKR